MLKKIVPFISGCLAVVLLVSACAAPIEPALNPTETALVAQSNPPESEPAEAITPASGARPLPATPALQEDSVATVFAATPQPGVTQPPETPVMPVDNPGQPMDPVAGLHQALALVDQEMRLAQSSSTLPEARRHAEGAVNVLVGYWGLWYGDADGDGTLYDPSGGQGIFPAGKVQEGASGGRAALPQLGWALRVFEMAGPTDQKQVERIIGDPLRWSNDRKASYADIQRVVDNYSGQAAQVSKLPGLVEQTLAWARLILLQGQTMDQVKALAAQGAAASTAALQVGQAIR